MADDEPVPYYPGFPCHLAPLRPGAAPLVGCDCRICEWARNKSDLAGVTGPVLPGTPAWDALLEAAIR